jgi:hypothetical protein
LRLYRWKWHHDGDGHDAERESVLADLDRQIAAQGRRQERDGYGHMVWVQLADSMAWRMVRFGSAISSPCQHRLNVMFRAGARSFDAW